MQVRNNDTLASGGPPFARPVGAGGARGCYSRLADEDLISLVGAGDVSAFTALYERHFRAVCSLARRLTLNEQDAEDLAQDVFLKIWRSAGSYRAAKGGVRTWVFSVVRNQSIDRLRSQATRRRTLAKAEDPSSPPDDPFDPCWRDLRRDRVREALGELPPAQRMVLALNHFCELTHAEIAERLCVPLGTVKGRMRLGLEKLRDHPELREKTVG
ncbi:MAG: sigma-70 family RNA polymerase sigma factor [Rubrobacteraceae bacterium]|nr:sigma-70 family RNA polymerase sigma factor [Rubrobacteraceae bacterium]